jgi:hypothetical protein
MYGARADWDLLDSGAWTLARDILMTADFMQRIRPDAIVPLLPPLFFSCILATSSTDDIEHIWYDDGGDARDCNTHRVDPRRPCPEFWDFLAALPVAPRGFNATDDNDFQGIYTMGCYRS